MTIVVDEKLTPENAPRLGYEWIQDTIYDSEAPKETMIDIENLINSGYKLGLPASTAMNFVGLYKKVDVK